MTQYKDQELIIDNITYTDKFLQKSEDRQHMARLSDEEKKESIYKEAVFSVGMTHMRMIYMKGLDEEYEGYRKGLTGEYGQGGLDLEDKMDNLMDDKIDRQSYAVHQWLWSRLLLNSQGIVTEKSSDQLSRELAALLPQASVPERILLSKVLCKKTEQLTAKEYQSELLRLYGQNSD